MAACPLLPLPGISICSSHIRQWSALVDFRPASCNESDSVFERVLEISEGESESTQFIKPTYQDNNLYLKKEEKKVTVIFSWVHWGLKCGHMTENKDPGKEAEGKRNAFYGPNRCTGDRCGSERILYRKRWKPPDNYLHNGDNAYHIIQAAGLSMLLKWHCLALSFHWLVFPKRINGRYYRCHQWGMGQSFHWFAK